MANRLKGEVAVEVGDGESRKMLIFRLGINELIGLQDALGMKDDDERFLATIDRPGSLKRLRAFAKAALTCHQPDITDEQAGDIVTQLGIPKLRQIIDEAVSWALPDKSDTPSGVTKGKGVAASPGTLPS